MAKHTKVKIKDIVDLKEKGLSNNQIGKLLGTSGNTVGAKLKKYEKEIGHKVGEAPPDIPEETIEAAEEKADKVKTPTTPWDADSNPFSLNLLSLRSKRDGFRNRFIKATPENIEKYEQMGFHVANCDDYGLKARVVGEEGRLDTTVRRRELILMELPEEIGQQRDAYVRHKTDRQTALRSADAMREHKRLRDAGVDLQLTVEKDTLEQRREGLQK